MGGISRNRIHACGFPAYLRPDGGNRTPIMLGPKPRAIPLGDIQVSGVSPESNRKRYR